MRSVRENSAPVHRVNRQERRSEPRSGVEHSRFGVVAIRDSVFICPKPRSARIAVKRARLV
jgi:hypothetical protein